MVSLIFFKKYLNKGVRLNGIQTWAIDFDEILDFLRFDVKFPRRHDDGDAMNQIWNMFVNRVSNFYPIMRSFKILWLILRHW